MTEAILDFLKNLPEELIVFLISILPIIELRGAVPIGAIFGLPFYTNYALSVLGNILPIPFILLFIPKILDFLARFKIFRPMVEWLRKKANKHSSK
ncbi:MAG: small multi-drug export protein, partial [Clostridia bacterium]|nr:small multi-drug export protein [Clostridia bacterium]